MAFRGLLPGLWQTLGQSRNLEVGNREGRDEIPLFGRSQPLAVREKTNAGPTLSRFERPLRRRLFV